MVHHPCEVINTGKEGSDAVKAGQSYSPVQSLEDQFLNFIYIVLSLGSNSSLSGFGAFEFQNHVFWANSVSIAL